MTKTEERIQELNLLIDQLTKEGLELVNDLFEGKEGAEEVLKERHEVYSNLYEERRNLLIKL